MTREDDYWTIVSGGRAEARRRRLEHRDRIVSRVYTLLAVLLLLGGLAIICTPPLNQWVTDGRLTATAQAARVSAATATDTDTRLEAADEYNRRLAAQQVQIGEIIRADGTRDADFKDDTEYQSLLRLDATGTMGVLSIPAIGVELPIRHGTGADVLDDGLGHVHGTSLPVGGENTRTVISGHTNMEGRTLFTRLDELGKDQTFTIGVYGRVLHYRITSIRIDRSERHGRPAHPTGQGPRHTRDLHGHRQQPPTARHRRTIHANPKRNPGNGLENHTGRSPGMLRHHIPGRPGRDATRP